MSKNQGNRFLKLAASVSQSIKDGWENVFTGLGISGRDKRTGASANYVRISEKNLENIYDSDDVGAKVVNMIPEEGTREWVTIKIPDNEKIEKAMVDDQKRLQVKNKIAKAWKWKRLYGGAGVYLSVDDGLEPHEPLNIHRLVKIKSLTVLHKFELQAQDINRDINDPNFGLPEHYHVSPRAGESVAMVHHSRIIRLDGADISESSFITNGYWGDSVLARMYNVLRNFNLVHDSSASVIQDFNIGILKLKNLAELIGSDHDDAVKERLRLMNLSKSILGTVLLDADEESFENRSVPLANLDKVIDKVNERLVAATNMPHTKILGNGPKANLSGGGDSEEKDWKAQVSNLQVSEIEEPINKIMELQFLAKQGPTNGKIPEDWEWFFNPLWQPTQKELAEVRELMSKADFNYWKTGALSGAQIAEQRFSGEEYSLETYVDPKDIEEQEKTRDITPEEAKKIIGDEVEGQEPETDGHWHLDPLGGNVGEAIDWGMNGEGQKIHTHKRAEGDNYIEPKTNGKHSHKTAHGETGPAINKNSGAA